MKKYTYISVFTAILMTSCLSLTNVNSDRTTVDMNRLEYGMSKKEVAYMFGQPRKVITATATSYGYLELLEYRDDWGEYYVLEFWDDYLTSVEYAYDSNNKYYYSTTTYYPSYPPRYTSPGKTVVVVRPSYSDSRHQGIPGQSSRPSYGSSTTSRPGSTTSTTSRPGYTIERPANTTTPVKPGGSVDRDGDATDPAHQQVTMFHQVTDRT